MVVAPFTRNGHAVEVESDDAPLWADQLRDISAFGLRFAENIYDKERYQVVQSVALEMLALATNEPLEQSNGVFERAFGADPRDCHAVAQVPMEPPVQPPQNEEDDRRPENPPRHGNTGSSVQAVIAAIGASA